eukprot:TRINITY_DN21282_c0_g5_i2.p1 TRINITY_DN21282_c0_g5~~TRINITY_DN21282_c0_g5_i2.p1  ORF type:complete len:632 (-),score=126.45 TRINITY_DN21282_c0_g5_i2:335-2113(-)
MAETWTSQHASSAPSTARAPPAAKETARPGVDPSKMRKLIETNEEMAHGVKAMSEKLANLDSRNYEDVGSTARQWAGNVHGLKANLEQLAEVSKATREGLRLDEEQQGESFREKYRFLLDRLKSDIRYYFQLMPEYMDVPHDFTKQRTWDLHMLQMEGSLREEEKRSSADTGIPSVDTLVAFINYRDAVIAELLKAILYQKAVLDWDMKSLRPYADGPMVELYDSIVELFSKTEAIPARYITKVPKLSESGPFTFDKAQQEKTTQNIGAAAAMLSPLQSRLLTVLQQMGSLDKGTRNLKLGNQVNIKEAGKNIAAEELRNEVSKWFERCQQLDHRLQSMKAERHSPLEQQIEQVRQKLEERELNNRLMSNKVHQLESEVGRLKNELDVTKREKADLAEKNLKLTKENLPVLDKMDKALQKSKESVDMLTADAELLSSMFRKQVQENRRNMEERDEISRQLSKLQRQLKQEQQKNKFKDDELQKKETLYLRTMAARKSIHESYLEQKAKISETEAMMAHRDKDWQEMLSVADGRTNEIRSLKEELARVHRRTDDLEQQKRMCLAEFQRITGKPFNALLEQCRTEQATSLPAIS